MSRLVILLCISCFSPLLFASSLAQELQSLLREMPRKDPARQELVLRLADTLFDEAGAAQVSKGQDPTAMRKEALRLYQQALKGEDCVPVGAMAAPKVKFQMAKLYDDLGDTARSTPLWTELAGASDRIEIQREALLRLAEREEKNPAQAEKAGVHYQQVVGLCGETDLCAYTHYRLAWLNRNRRQMPAALREMELALYDSKGQLKEEVLRDFLSFWVQSSESAEAAISRIEALEAKHGRKDLLGNLADGYLAAGKRAQGVAALEVLNRRSPELAVNVRLLEEYFAARDYEKLSATLEALGHQATGPATANDASERILRRVAVQLDGNRENHKESAQYFQKVVELHLTLYPEHAERFKMVEGWMAAEKDPENRLQRASLWLAKLPNLATPEKKKLYEWQVSASQKLLKRSELVAALGNLLPLETSPEKVREYRYWKALAESELNPDTPLVDFETLAAVSDEWGTRSRCLVVNRYADAKDYARIVETIPQWNSGGGTLSKEAKTCQADLPQLLEQARFEQALSLGQTEVALQTFEKFCTSATLDPKVHTKSCENAKVLALNLRDQPAVLRILTALGDKSTLATELEASGRFVESAELLEETTKSPREAVLNLRIALLYELGGKLGDRDRVLKTALLDLKNATQLGELESGFFQTALEAGVLRVEHWTLGWNPANLSRLANYLEERGRGNPTTRAALLASKESVGKGWTKVVTQEAERLALAGRRIRFHGADGERKFEKRVEALKNLSRFTDPYLAGADVDTKAALTALLVKEHQDLATEILAAPVPKGLSEAETLELQGNLARLAEPFKEKAGQYAALQPAPTSGGTALAEAIRLEYPKSALLALGQNPRDRASLETLKAYYDKSGQPRLASYFAGRIQETPGEQTHATP